MSDYLRERYAEALFRHEYPRSTAWESSVTNRSLWFARADAVLAVHVPEVERLRAEVEHWKFHAEEAGQGFTQVCRDYARVSARNVDLVDRAEVAEARLAAVEALCRRESRKADVHKDKCLLTVGQVRAALASVPDVDAGDREPASEVWCSCGSPDAYALTSGERIVHGTAVCLICREVSGAASEVQP